MTISPALFRRFEKSILMENFEVAAKCADGFLAHGTWGGLPNKGVTMILRKLCLRRGKQWLQNGFCFVKFCTDPS